SGVTVNASTALTIDAGGTIDVSGRGYGAATTYPGATAATNQTGGSHIGLGALSGGSTQPTSFGSVYRPQEAGGGDGDSNNYPGGGIVRVSSGALTVNGMIKANGLGDTSGNGRSGAGGSIWITSGTVAGTGTIEAR